MIRKKPIPERPVEISQEMKLFLGWLSTEKGLSDNTKESYYLDLLHLSEYFDSKNLNEKDVKTQDLQEYIEELHKLKFAPSSTQRNISAIRGYYSFLFAEDIIKHDPAQNLDSPKLAQYLPGTLCVEDVFKILENAADENEKTPLRNRAVLELLYSTGMRVSECVSITTDQFSAHKDEGFMFVIGKGNKERLVPIGDEALKWVEKYLKKERNSLVKSESANFLFLNQGRGIGRGRPLTRAAVWNIIKQAALRANITAKVSPHTMRHSFATHLLEGGCDLRIVQEFLGHSSITTTEIYTHITNTYLLETHRFYHPRQKKR